MLPNIKVGGTQGYNQNQTMPIVTAAGGAAYTACATACSAVYPEPVTGNWLFYTNTDDSSKTAIVFYTGTAWKKEDA